MYFVSFCLIGCGLKYNKHYQLQLAVSDFIFYLAMAAVIGGRIGYVLFYGLKFWAQDPFFPFKIWEGGMSFHGGLLGVTLALLIIARREKVNILALGDLIAPWVPLGLALGRVGNFLNGELWGRVTDLPWGMVFAGAGALPRHPSELYEALLEGILLFIGLQIYARKPRCSGEMTAFFLIGYGVTRIFCECFREPDLHIGYMFAQLTLGQILTLPLILSGILILCYLQIKKTNASKN